jgi:hypothetical protein
VGSLTIYHNIGQVTPFGRNLTYSFVEVAALSAFGIDL